MSATTIRHAVDDREAVGPSVYERLLEMLVSLELEPGTVVTESVLLARVGGARSTLREAVQRLTDTGLVSVLPRTGIAVAPVRLLDVQNVYEARLALETCLVRLAAERATPTDLEGLVASSAARPPSAGPADFMASDRRIHASIAALARNDLLSRALVNVLLTSSRMWALFFRLNGAGDNYYFSHDEILDAVRRRDADAAQAAVERHLEGSRNLLRSVFWPE